MATPQQKAAITTKLRKLERQVEEDLTAIRHNHFTEDQVNTLAADYEASLEHILEDAETRFEDNEFSYVHVRHMTNIISALVDMNGEAANRNWGQRVIVHVNRLLDVAQSLSNEIRSKSE